MFETNQPLPADLEAEEFILGTLLLEGRDTYLQVSARLGAEDFNLEANRRIFSAATQIYRNGEEVDAMSVGKFLLDKNQLHSCGGLDRLAGLITNELLPPVCKLDPRLLAVKEKALKRGALVGIDEAMHECLNGSAPRDISEMLSKVASDLNAVPSDEPGAASPADIIAEAGGLQSFLNERSAGLATPWTKLNEIIGGLQPQQLVILAARPGIGKTTAAMQIAEHVASHGTAVEIFSLEMSRKSLLKRMICSRARVPSNLFRDGQLDQRERKLLNAAATEIAELPILFDETAACTVAAMRAALEQRMVTRPLGLVIVDYLQLMLPSSKGSNRSEEVSAISRGLKLATMELHIPFLVLSQLNRESAKTNSRPRLDQLGESGSIERDADVVLFLYVKETEEEPPPVQPVKLIVAKQRDGPVGSDTLRFLRKCGRFENATPEERAEDGYDNDY